MNAFGYVLFHLTSTRLVDYNTENVSRFQVGFFFSTHNTVIREGR